MPQKQKDGRYRAKLTVAPGQKPLWISARTLRELEEKKRWAREHYVDGRRPRDITFHALVIEWFEQIKRPRIERDSTLRGYQNAINLHLLPFFSPRQRLRAVSRADLQRCLDQLDGQSASTASLVLSVIRHAMAYAMAERLLSSNPADSLMLPRARRCPPKRAFTPEEEERLLAVAASDPDGMLLYVLYYLGCRRGELLGLCWGDFDWNQRMVHIQRSVAFGRAQGASPFQPPKSAAGDRWVPVPDALYTLLRPLCGPERQLLFAQGDNQPLGESAFRSRWKRLMREAGFGEEAVSITPHWFRHHYITACVLAGVPAEVTMRLVGHTDYRTTINIYTHIQQEQKRRAVVSLSGVLRGADGKEKKGKGATVGGKRATKER